jgi:ABC-type transport system involved in multi-copper enzyme maturation permease subunit
MVSVNQQNYETNESTYTKYDAIAMKKASMKDLEGDLTTDRIASTIQLYKDMKRDPKNLDEHGMLKNDVYLEKWQKYEDINSLICQIYSEKNSFDPYVISKLSRDDGLQFYNIYSKKMNAPSENKKPFYYGYHLGFKTLLQDIGVIITMVALGLCICIASIFSREFESKTSTILYTSEKGRLSLGRAKLLSAYIFASINYLIIMTIYVLIVLGIYGFDGSNVSIQIFKLFSKTDATMIQVVLISLIRGYFGLILAVTLSIYCSLAFKKTYHAILLSICVLLIPIFIPIPKNMSLFTHILLMFPSNMMNIESLTKVGTLMIKNTEVPLATIQILTSFVISVILFSLTIVKHKKMNIINE